MSTYSEFKHGNKNTVKSGFHHVQPIFKIFTPVLKFKVFLAAVQ